MKLIVWLIVSSVWAVQPVTVEDLRSALKKYQGMTNLEVDFKQIKTLKDMDIKVESEGHMSIEMPDLVRWQMTKPSSMKVELNRDHITIESASAKNNVDTAQIPVAQRQEFLNMFNWLKLDADAIAKSYSVTKTGRDAYTFAANDSGAMFKSLDMTLDKDGHVKDMRFKEKSDDEMFLRFSKPIVKYAKKK